MSLKAVFFDFNGVICDDEHIHCDLVCELSQKQGFLVTREDYFKDFVGYDDKACFEEIFKRNNKQLMPEKLFGLIDQKHKLYKEKIHDQLKIFPGVIDTIQRLSVSYPIALVSGALRSEIELVLDTIEIRDCFCFIVAAEDTSHSKPHPEGYLKAFDLMRGHIKDLQPLECLVIEDTVAGIEAAKKSGMICMAVANSYLESELRTADWVRANLVGFEIREAEQYVK